MGQVVLPALYDFDPIVIAPDCPAQSWTDPAAEQAVMQLVRRVMTDYAVDRRQVLITGFSMGGRGTWFLSSRPQAPFTGAIVMAGSAASLPTDTLARIPTYVIHSREDEVVPFEPAERTAAALAKQGRPVHFEALDGPGHFEMSEYVAPLERAAAWMFEHWKYGRSFRTRHQARKQAPGRRTQDP
jgi:predicted peptidase